MYAFSSQFIHNIGGLSGLLLFSHQCLSMLNAHPEMTNERHLRKLGRSRKRRAFCGGCIEMVGNVHGELCVSFPIPNTHKCLILNPQRLQNLGSFPKTKSTYFGTRIVFPTQCREYGFSATSEALVKPKRGTADDAIRMGPMSCTCSAAAKRGVVLA